MTFFVKVPKKHTWLVCVPDLETFTEGRTFQKAVRMAEDAISLDLATRNEMGLEFPIPSTGTTLNEKLKILDVDGIFRKSKRFGIKVDLIKYEKKLQRLDARYRVLNDLRNLFSHLHLRTKNVYGTLK